MQKIYCYFGVQKNIENFVDIAQIR